MFDSKVSHDDIKNFAEDKVNLPGDKVKEYRQQVNNLREKLEKHIEENPDFGLLKMLNSGSVAKGTALKTINDMDVAVYVDKSLESDENELLDWIMARLKEA